MPKEVEAKISSEFTLVDALMKMEENLKEEKGCSSNYEKIFVINFLTVNFSVSKFFRKL